MFRAVLWHVLMVVWLGGLVSGVWWIWPHVEKMALTADLVAGVLWIAMGALAWIVAFNYGRQRYWRQR
jgi:hypothetical protein